MIFQYWSIQEFSTVQTLLSIFHMLLLRTLTQDATNLYQHPAKASLRSLPGFQAFQLLTFSVNHLYNTPHRGEKRLL